MSKWNNELIKEITFIVTKDCQLACKYCYLVGKNSEERMSWTMAKKAVDYILSNEYDEIFDTQGVVFDFIGGEPFLEIELVDKICDYIQERLKVTNHHWKDHYKFSLTTNGINYSSEKVQKFINKNIDHLHITITIDGTERKHNLNRIWKNQDDEKKEDKGSYTDVVKNIPLWLSQFPDAATKVTISSDCIPFISESVLHLFELGIKDVHINCVFEDVWKDGDDDAFEKQLKKLADEMVCRGLYPSHNCTFFDQSIGHPMESRNDCNWCGAGMMLSIDASGNFYPCTRFAKYSLREKAPRIIGTIEDGIDKNKLRPFYALSRSVQSPQKCLECEVASGCAWCQGENYDASESGTIFQRSTAICKMHKARVRANNYFWQMVEDDYICVSDRVSSDSLIDKKPSRLKGVIVLLSNESISYCNIDNPQLTNSNKVEISESNLHSIINFAGESNLSLQFVFPNGNISNKLLKLIESIQHKKIVPLNSIYSGDAIVIDDWEQIKNQNFESKFYILRTEFKDFYDHVLLLADILHKANRLNIIFKYNMDGFIDYLYSKTLNTLKGIVLHEWKRGHHVNVNIMSDRLYLNEMSNCEAGNNYVTLAPNGKFYICPSFYYESPDDNCGDIVSGIKIKNPLLYKLNHAPLCRNCKSYHCDRCVFINKKKTLEVNIPSFEQCEKARIELEITKSFYELIVT